jgi:hypothetical protein
MSELQPLLPPGRYSPKGWAYAVAGTCNWLVELDSAHEGIFCGEPSSATSFYRYCADHDREACEEFLYYGQ